MREEFYCLKNWEFWEFYQWYETSRVPNISHSSNCTNKHPRTQPHAFQLIKHKTADNIVGAKICRDQDVWEHMYIIPQSDLDKQKNEDD